MKTELAKSLLKNWHASIVALDNIFDELKSSLGSSPNLPLWVASYKSVELHTETLDRLLSGDGEDYGWLSWYWLECNLGENPMEMSFANGEKLTVVGLDDLWDVINTDEDGNRKFEEP